MFDLGFSTAGMQGVKKLKLYIDKLPVCYDLIDWRTGYLAHGNGIEFHAESGMEVVVMQFPELTDYFKSWLFSASLVFLEMSERK